jgi:peptidoglycan-associated lipoprotein
MCQHQWKGGKGMRNRGWWVVATVIVLPVIFFTASCAKKEVVKSQPVSMTAPEVQKAPDRPAEEAKPDVRIEEDRLRAETAAREAALAAFVGENIHFAFDSYLLSDQAGQILADKAEYLRTNPDVTVTVEGHCDDRGTSEYNIALGERRAESVKRFLVNLGIGTNRLNTISYGEERPIATGHDEDSWAENRRAQFAIN